MTTWKTTFDEPSAFSWMDLQVPMQGEAALGTLPSASASERGPARHGPHALMLAILEDAIWCVGRLAGSSRTASDRPDPVGQRARAWILQRGSEWIFSFENVCEELGLDAEKLRARLVPCEGGRSDLETLIRRRSHTVRSVRVGGRRRRSEQRGERAA